MPKRTLAPFASLVFALTIAAAAVTTLTARPAVTTTTTTAADPIVKYFSGRRYEGDTRLYTVDDLRIPASLVAEVTNRGLSWLALLRNEISARRGYVFTTTAYKDIFGRTSWYRADPAFDPQTGLTPQEQTNVKFIRRFEDMAVRYGARELPLVLDLPKEDISTGEAIEVYKATGDTNVLTKVRDPQLTALVGGGRLYMQMTASNENPSNCHPDIGQMTMAYIHNAQHGTFHYFHLGDRLLLNLGVGRLEEECVSETNVKVLFETPDDCLDEGWDYYIVPALGLAGVDAKGNPVLTGLIYNPHGRPSITNSGTEGRRSVYTEDSNYYGYFEGTSYQGILLWSFVAFDVEDVPDRYLIQEIGKSLYILIPSGDVVKVFRITVLD